MTEAVHCNSQSGTLRPEWSGANVSLKAFGLAALETLKSNVRATQRVDVTQRSFTPLNRNDKTRLF
jgi:hypothetical protein